jgi:hypothetical protein
MDRGSKSITQKAINIEMIFDSFAFKILATEETGFELTK